MNTKKISLVKILWNKHAIEEATWKHGDEIHAKYPQLFNNYNKLVSKIKFSLVGKNYKYIYTNIINLI